MKKLFFAALLCVATSQCIAQSSLYETFMGNRKAVFTYMNIYKNADVVFEFDNLKQVNCVPNLDSILSLVKQELAFLPDTLKDDATVRTLKYIVTKKQNFITIINHNQLPFNYIVQNKELKLLKTFQDTLDIVIPVFSGDSIFSYSDINRHKEPYYTDVHIKISLNNIKDIVEIKNNLLCVCLNDIQQKSIDKKIMKRNYWELLTGSARLINTAFDKPVINYWNIKSKPKKHLDLTFSFCFQNANNSWLTSFNIGAKLISYSAYKYITHWSFTLDNYYNASTDGAGFLNKDRCSFLTLKLWQKFEYLKNEKGFVFTPGFSFGYLINRTGNLFDKDTYKLSFPGLSNGWLSLEPEIFFTQFFKNTTLSLKLCINYE